MKATTNSTVRLGILDKAGLKAHFRSLAGEDRRLRFGSGISDSGLDAYVDRIDFERDGLFAVQDDRLRLLAVVHVGCAEDYSEMGLSVLQGCRQQGLGNILFERALTFLRNRGARSVFVHCLAENAAMMHLARKNGMRIAYSGSESDARLELEPATAETFVREWLDDQRGRMVQTLRHNASLARTVMNSFSASA